MTPASLLVRLLSGLLAACSLGACQDNSEPGGGAGASGDGLHWVATWYAAPQDAATSVGDITYRLLIHNALGGQTVRLRFSNRYGDETLILRNVSIALPVALKLPPVDAATLRPVSFNGARQASIPAGQELRSDPLDFELPADADVAVTFYVAGGGNMTAHSNALTTSWSNGSGGGDTTGDALGLSLLHVEAGRSFLTGVEVIAAPQTTTVVALGDSITDVAFEIPNSDARWPDLLNDRIAGSDLAGRRSVVNAGITGNMLTADRDGNAVQGQAAISRIAWDVFEQPNVSHLIVFEGINDVGEDVSGGAIVQGLEAIVAEARRRGIKVILATLTPCFAAATAGLSYSLHADVRLPVNDWILHSGVPDDVIDFNAAVGSGLQPETWLPWLTMDFLHPNPLGLVVLANAIPLDVLR